MFPKKWRKTVRFKHLLNRAEGSDEAERTGREIAERLKKQLADEIDEDVALWEIVENLENVGEDGAPLTELNESLSDLYDWGDRNRVWFE